MSPTRLLVRPGSALFSHNAGPSNRFYTCRRTFLAQAAQTLSGVTKPQTLHASRQLPYKVEDLYKLISDISQYPTFIPYCSSASVQTYSAPDPTTSKRWPATASLCIGYASFSETFLSKVYCVPGPDFIVEAISGDAVTSLPAASLPHYAGLDSNQARTRNDLFASLRTRWSLRGFNYKPGEKHPDVVAGTAHPSQVSVEDKGSPEGKGVEAEPRTAVNLIIEVDWKNPVYAAAAQAVAPSVANKIVEAFERRAREVLGGKTGP